MHKYSTIGLIVGTAFALAFTHASIQLQVLLLLAVLFLIVVIPALIRLAKKLVKPDSVLKKGMDKSLLNRISIKAFFISNLLFAILLVVSMISLTIIGFLIYQYAHTGPFNRADFENTIDGSNTLSVLFVFFLLFVCIYSGYVAACIANRHEILNGFLSQTLSILIALYELFNGPLYQPHHDWKIISPMADNILSFVTPFLGAFGGYLRIRVMQSAKSKK